MSKFRKKPVVVEAAQWLREAGMPLTAEQMLHELKEAK